MHYKSRKPDSVLYYHLSAINITVYLLLPTLERRYENIISFERAVLLRSYTWHYSTQGLPILCITAEHCELLPHIFTLAIVGTDGQRQLFSVALSLFLLIRKAGCSPVSCSMLSGLSFPILSER